MSADNPSPGAVAVLWEDPYRKGDARAISTFPSGRYDYIYFFTRSVTLFTPAHGASFLVGDFDSKPTSAIGGHIYKMWVNATGQEWDIDTIDWKPSWLMGCYYIPFAIIVHTQRALEYRISIRALFGERMSGSTQEFLNNISSQGINIQMVGDPNIAWVFWPTDSTLLNSSRMYIRFAQLLHINVDTSWPASWFVTEDYDVWLYLWIYVYVTDNGNVNARIEYADFSVSEGNLSSFVSAVVSPNLRLFVIDWNETRQNIWDRGGVKDLYLLPGTHLEQLHNSQQYIDFSYGEDDVTVVAEF